MLTLTEEEKAALRITKMEEEKILKTVEGFKNEVISDAYFLLLKHCAEQQKVDLAVKPSYPEWAGFCVDAKVANRWDPITITYATLFHRWIMWGFQISDENEEILNRLAVLSKAAEERDEVRSQLMQVRAQLRSVDEENYRLKEEMATLAMCAKEVLNSKDPQFDDYQRVAEMVAKNG